MSSDRQDIVYFAIADYVLLGVMLVGSMAIGLYFAVYAIRKGTNEEYLLGGRRLKALPVCLSLFATFMSAISLIGYPTEVYSYGTMIMYCQVGIALSSIVAMFTVVPLMYPLKLTSVYEYLNLRFQSRTVQLLGAAFGVMSTLSYMTVALLTPALALETAVGIPLWLSIILVGSVGTVYTTLGGMKSVIWTDVFQTFIIYAGIFSVIIKATIDAGGVDKVWQINKDSGRIVFDDVRLDPRVRHTVWNLSIGQAVYYLGHHFSQSSVQRLVSTQSVQDARKVYLFTIPLHIGFVTVLCLTGLVLVAYFFEIGCDPFAAGYISNANQLVPFFVIHTLSFLPGLSGLYIATLFSGALSTLSSGINSLAAITVQDFLCWFMRNKSELYTTTATKGLACLYGVACTGLAYVFKNVQGPLIQVGYTAVASTNGPLLGLFLLSGLFPQANTEGAVIGFLSSIMLSYWQAIGSLQFGHPTEKLPMGPTDQCSSGNSSVSSFYLASTNTSILQKIDSVDARQPAFSLYDISYVWAPVSGAVITIAIGLTTSFVTNKLFSRVARPEAKLLFPFCRRFWYFDREVVHAEVPLSERPLKTGNQKDIS